MPDVTLQQLYQDLQDPLGLEALTPFDQPIIVLKKTADGAAFVLVNKDWHQPQQMELGWLEPPAVAHLIRVRPDGEVIRETVPGRVQLDPAEIALIA